MKILSLAAAAALLGVGAGVAMGVRARAAAALPRTPSAPPPPAGRPKLALVAPYQAPSILAAFPMLMVGSLGFPDLTMLANALVHGHKTADPKLIDELYAITWEGILRGAANKEARQAVISYEWSGRKQSDQTRALRLAEKLSDLVVAPYLGQTFNVNAPGEGFPTIITDIIAAALGHGTQLVIGPTTSGGPYHNIWKGRGQELAALAEHQGCWLVPSGGDTSGPMYRILDTGGYPTSAWWSLSGPSGKPCAADFSRAAIARFSALLA